MADEVLLHPEMPMRLVSVHFDVPGSFLALETFIETARHTEEVLISLNEVLFDGGSQCRVVVLPPEYGSFKTRLGVAVVAVSSAGWVALESEIGRGFVRGLTGHEPAYWAEQLGTGIREVGHEITSFQPLIVRSDPMKPAGDDEASDDELEDHERDASLCMIASRIVSESATSFLQLDTQVLSSSGVRPSIFREAYEARNGFYGACIQDESIQGVGFGDDDGFPIRNGDFFGFYVALPPREQEAVQTRWIVDIADIRVTSPNWERRDSHRLWKAKSVTGRDRYFRIDDEYFWVLVDEKKLNPSIVDVLKVQWAFQLLEGRMREIRVLKVLEYNGEYVSSPLDQNALISILGNFNRAGDSDHYGDLFDR